MHILLKGTPWETGTGKYLTRTWRTAVTAQKAQSSSPKPKKGSMLGSGTQISVSICVLPGFTAAAANLPVGSRGKQNMKISTCYPRRYLKIRVKVLGPLCTRIGQESTKQSTTRFSPLNTHDRTPDNCLYPVTNERRFSFEVANGITAINTKREHCPQGMDKGTPYETKPGPSAPSFPRNHSEDLPLNCPRSSAGERKANSHQSQPHPLKPWYLPSPLDRIKHLVSNF